MLDIDLQTAKDFLDTNWGWAAGLAASMLGLTLAAGALLNPARKDEIALWLMGAQSEENWSRSFVSLFDGLFGARHLSLTCMVRSAVASLLAVVVIWLLMGNVAAIGPRLQSELSLGGVLGIALVVNLAADYLSLLETRLLLGQMHKLRSGLAQLGVLLFDLAVSGLIIWLAILAYLVSPLHEGEVESFAEILGLFTIFSVFFYSTFLTSVWTWAYILSTWVMRFCARLRLAALLDVEHQPMRVLGSVLALVVFVGALGLAVPLRKDPSGVTLADRAICSVFKGKVCMDVAGLTATEEAQLEFILLACEGGLTRECLDRGWDIYEIDGPKAASLFSAACGAGGMDGCSGLGVLYEEGIGVEFDPNQAARLYFQACDGGFAGGCLNLGYMYRHGIGVDPEPTEAARLYRLACDMGSLGGCNNLGLLHVDGIGVDRDPTEAARLFRQACDGGIGRSCTNLGVLHEEGIGMDPAEAARLFRQGCDGGNAGGCNNLGVLHERGIGMDPDPAEAARLYQQACDGGDAGGCTNLGYFHERGIGMDTDPAEAARLYRQGCDGGSARGCTILGFLHESGIGMDPDPAEAARLYRQACNDGYASGCTSLGFLLEFGVSLVPDPAEAARFYRKGCDGGSMLSCTNLQILEERGIVVEEPDPAEQADQLQ